METPAFVQHKPVNELELYCACISNTVESAKAVFDSMVLPPLNTAIPPEIVGAPPQGTNQDDDKEEPGKSSNSKFPVAVAVGVNVAGKGVGVGVAVLVGVFVAAPKLVGVLVGVDVGKVGPCP